MNVIYTLEEVNHDRNKHSIFLAGPTPRSKEVKSWRPKALEFLKSSGYDGVIYVPEFNPKVGMPDPFDPINMYEWEHEALTNSTVIVFWVPRELVSMPAFTTNIEAGRFFSDARSLYGRPDDAPKNEYIDWYYKKVSSKKPYDIMEDLLWEAMWHFYSAAQWKKYADGVSE